MADAARAFGLDYIAITEHSRRVTVARGLTPDRLLNQLEEIDRLSQWKLGIALLKGIEVDVLEDGSLDLPNDVLCRLDLVVGAIHSRFDLSRAKQTERILRAMDHPHFTILAHPSGRLIPDREPTMSICPGSSSTPLPVAAISSCGGETGGRADQHQLRRPQCARLRKPALRH